MQGWKCGKAGKCYKMRAGKSNGSKNGSNNKGSVNGNVNGACGLACCGAALALIPGRRTTDSCGSVMHGLDARRQQ